MGCMDLTPMMENAMEKQGNICMPEEACKHVATGLPRSALIPCMPNTILPRFATWRLRHKGPESWHVCSMT